MVREITMFGMMALVAALVSSEIYSMLAAVGYARKQNGSLLQKASLAYARYSWASVVFHEFYNENIKEKPAYRVSVPLFIWAGMMATYVGVFYAAGVDVGADTAMGSSLATAALFFIGSYGASFSASRKNVAEQIQAGTWLAA